MRRSLMILTILNLGCTSTVSTIVEESDAGNDVESFAGSAGEISTGSGGNSGSSGNNSGGSGNFGTGGNSSGGTGGNSGSAGNSFAGSAGMENDAGGIAGMAGTAGIENDAGMQNDSGNNTGGSSSCIPKTCTTIAVELNGTTGVSPSGTPIEACGLVDNGCGNYIDCGSCSNEYEACGYSSIGTDGQASNNGIPNLCGGGCTKANDSTANFFFQTNFCNGPSYTSIWVCAVEITTQNPPDETAGRNCVPSAIGNGWCCD